MKAYGGSACIDPHFLDLGTNWRWVVSFTSRPLYPLGKSPRYPLDRRLDGPQSRSGQRGEEKFLPLPGLELRLLGRSDSSQSLYRLRYPGSWDVVGRLWIVTWEGCGRKRSLSVFMVKLMWYPEIHLELLRKAYAILRKDEYIGQEWWWCNYYTSK
jgi:hypothetical protein